MNLQNKKVLVTGSSKGIGSAIAVAFAQEGAAVAINFKSDQESAKKVLAECNKVSGGNFIIQGDVSDEESVITLVQKVKEEFGSVDVLINNAGIFDGADNPTNLEAFDNIYRNNFLSAVQVTKHILPLMTQGKIINISSIHARLGHGRVGATAYSAFKAALENYSKNLAKDLAPNILVNCIAPGRVETPLWGDLNQSDKTDLGHGHLIQRMIQPSEIADGAVFLAKSEAICGEVLVIDGGMSLVTFG